MRKSFLDDLARALATSMPRRQALRIIGATLAMGAFRALRPGRAAGYAGSTSAYPNDCGPRAKRCFVAIKYGTHEGGCCYTGLEECCDGPNNSKDHPNKMSWCCPTGMCGASGGQCRKNCPPGRQACGNECCPPGWFCGSGVCCKKGEKACVGTRGAGCCKSDQECEDGLCKPCEEDNVCGQACCEPEEFCGSKLRSICCKQGENVCVVPGKDNPGTCCKPGQKCCFNDKSAKCCYANQTCVNGSCKCSNKADTRCGDECCTKSEVCSDGKCCPKGKDNCGGDCCDKGLCCVTNAFDDKLCCKQGEFCAAVAGAPGNKNCCPSARIMTTPLGVPVCCPTGTVPKAQGGCCPPGKPNCCDQDDLDKLCPKGQICSLGECVPI